MAILTRPALNLGNRLVRFLIMVHRGWARGAKHYSRKNNGVLLTRGISPDSHAVAR